MKSTYPILILLGLCFSGCSDDGGDPRSVILISIDTLRADRLGCYGYDRPTSPFLDEFADSGLLFESAVAQSPWTLPSHAALLSGLYPHRIGVVDEWKRMPDQAPTLASILSENGYFTGSIVNSYWISELFGFNKGFETTKFIDETKGNKGREITDEAIAWLEENGKKPFFLFVHYYDVHSDYAPEKPFRDLFTGGYEGEAAGTTQELLGVRGGKVEYSEECLAHVSNLYDAEIRQLDEQLRRLFDHIRKKGMEKDVLAVITSDHGEEFMEHGDVLHGRTLYREVMHVPFLMGGPDIPKGRRVKEPAMLIDVVPTVLGYLDILTAETFDGKDLLRRMRSPSPQDAERLVFASADHNNEKPDILRMVQSLQFKYCYNRLTEDGELFDLTRDALEQSNVAEDHPEVVERFKEQLERLMAQKAAGEETGPRSEEEIRRLKELGY